MDHSALTIDAYNHNATRYAKKFMDFDSYRKKLLHFQQRYLVGASDILDLGCGPGNSAKLLCEQNPAYHINGIDLSEDMIALAKMNVPAGAFQQGDIRQFNFDRTFDAVIASFCIVHLQYDETEKLIVNISDHLKNGGYLYLSFMEGKTPGLESTSFSEKLIFFNYYQREFIQKVLEKQGFEVLEVLNDDYPEDDGSTTTDVFIFARS